MAEDVDGPIDDGWVDAGAEYSPKSEFSKPALVYIAFQKCIETRATEMRGGYYNTNVSKSGFPIRIWVEDTRKVYCSSVIALRACLEPEILIEEADKEFFSKSKEEKGDAWIHPANLIDLDKIEKEFSYYIYEVYNDEGKQKYKKTDNSYMPEIDAIVEIRNIYPDGNERLVPMPKYWNKYIDAYWNKMVKECDKLYKECMRVVHRTNYFKQQIRF